MMNLFGGMSGAMMKSPSGNAAPRSMMAKALRRPPTGMPVETTSPRPGDQSTSWGWQQQGGGMGGGKMTQMGFGDALGSFLNEMSGGQGVKGAIYGPAAAQQIPNYKPGQVRAVAPSKWSSPFNMPGGGKRGR